MFRGLFEIDAGARFEPAMLCQQFAALSQAIEAIGRVEEHDINRRHRAAQKRKGIASDDAAMCCFECDEMLPDLIGNARILFDEYDFSSAAR